MGPAPAASTSRQVLDVNAIVGSRPPWSRSARPLTRTRSKRHRADTRAARSPRGAAAPELARPLKCPGAMTPINEVHQEARALADRHLPCIWRVAGQLARRLAPNVQAEDLIAAGYEGLLDAARRYDPARTTRFDVYAEHRVRGAMLDALRDFDPVGRTTRSWAHRIQEATRRLSQRLGREPEEEEVAYELDLDVEQYRRVLTGMARRTVSSFEGQEISAIGDTETAASADQQRAHVMAALDRLPARQRLVITLYYFEELTLKEIGRVLGVGESRAGQIHSEALARLRGPLKEHGREFVIPVR